MSKRRARSLVLAAPWFALAACTTPASVPDARDMADDPGAVVSALRFEGVASIDESMLRDGILTTPRSRWPWAEAPPPFDEDVLREDLERVTAIYEQQGFYAARAQYRLDWSDERRAVAVAILVDEGEPVRLASLELDLRDARGVELGAPDAWRATLPLKVGERFSVPAYADAKAALVARATAQGFLDARIDGGAEIDPIARRADVDWALHAGPRVRVDEIRVEGLDAIAPRLALREVALAPGDLVTPDALRATQRAVYETDFFRTVSVETQSAGTAPPEADEARRTVVLRVEERSPRSVRTSLGYGTEEGVRVRLGWEHRNWLGGGRRLEFEGSYSSLAFGFSSVFFQPDFPDASSDLRVRGEALREDEPAYDADRLRAGPEIERRFGEHWTGRVGLGWDWNRLLDSPDEPPSRLDFERDETVRIGFARAGLGFADLDDPLNPTRGLRIDATLRAATRVLGSQVSFLQGRAEARGYLPFGPTVLALRIGLGATEPVGGSAEGDIPIFERFFTGGSTSVRGFDYHEVGPKDADGDPLGGLSLVEASAELRFPVWRELGGVVFVDAGGLGPDPFDFFDDVSVSVGAGIRYRTPVGPLRLDVGHAVHSTSGADAFRIHFSIGQAF